MTYVMSDIHGNMERYRSVMKKIHLTAEDHLYVLGDVIDRGADGIAIFMELMRMPNVTVLLGNHELMMLDAIQSEFSHQSFRLWLRNGGMPTMDAYVNLPQEQQREILEYIQKMPLTANVTVSGRSYLLVHGVPPTLWGTIRSDAVCEVEFAVWARLMPDDPIPDGKTVIFGHTPTEYYQEGLPLRIWYGGNKIGIDCGSGYEHEVCRLACLRLEDMMELYSG